MIAHPGDRPRCYSLRPIWACGAPTRARSRLRNRRFRNSACWPDCAKDLGAG